MNISIQGAIRGAGSAAMLLALAASGLAPASAAPAYHYTCVAEVSTAYVPDIPGQSGAATLATQVVTGATLHQAVGACHQFARNAFNANTSWSSPAAFCARYSQPLYEQNLGNTAKTHAVWVTDYFQEMGHANGYNRVGGYNVICNGPANLVQLPLTATLVPTLL